MSLFIRGPGLSRLKDYPPVTFGFDKVPSYSFPIHEMKTLGITGGIGSGKSTVAAMLAEKPGVRVVNADDEAKRLMVEDADLHDALVDRFGPSTFRSNRSLNRAGLAARVFSDPEELRALNELVHPVVRKELVKSISAAERDGIELFVYEVALFNEINVAGLMDAVLLVDAPKETRIRRVMERNQISRKEVVARLGHQATPHELRPLADYVIENNSDVPTLRDSVDSIYRTIVNN